ncbi:hypothetical protein EDC27_2686 [Desulfosoma caldarium]|uniref:Uncharacterized protein n=1 Tax=Desulfosoma caldarium TaxID=610254 RepID=A0A3N1UHQ4_9BACT|nr:hypothetical protein EDC27_2686 [Desulfosoma caldarium]
MIEPSAPYLVDSSMWRVMDAKPIASGFYHKGLCGNKDHRCGKHEKSPSHQ